MKQRDGGLVRLRPGTSPDDAKSALRTSLQWRVQGTISDDDVRQSLRQVCVHVRESGATASDLIIMLKQVWASIPEIVRQPANRMHEEVRSRMVSMAIAEYYRPGTDPADGGQRAPRA